MPPRNIIATNDDMKKVKGSLIAMALTNEIPGSAPATTPTSTAMIMTPRFSGCSAIARPWMNPDSVSMAGARSINAEQAIEEDRRFLEHALAAVERHEAELDEQVQDGRSAERAHHQHGDWAAQAGQHQPGGHERRRRPCHAEQRDAESVGHDEDHPGDELRVVVFRFVRCTARRRRLLEQVADEYRHQARCRAIEHELGPSARSRHPARHAV